MTVFTRLLADRRRGALGWTIGMMAGVASIVGLWPTVRDNDDMERVVRDLPASVRALIGSQEGIPLTSAPGYLQARLFSTILPILLLVYAISLGSRAIGAAEEDGTLQLVVTAPVTRRHIATQRFAASVALLLGLAVVGLATALVLGAIVGIFDDIAIGRMLVATFAVLGLALLHLAVAFTFGAITGRRGPAVSAASSLAVGGYVLHGLAASSDVIRPVRVVSPWWWLLDRNLLVQDPSFLAVGVPLLLAAATFAFGVLRFEQRDLRFP